MKKLLVFTSLIELALGITLFFIPSTVLILLFGSEESHITIMLGRFTGIVFICFGLACFPLKQFAGDLRQTPAFRAMFIYNAMAAIYLGYLKFIDNFNGVILLPAVILHALITFYFVYVSMKKEEF